MTIAGSVSAAPAIEHRGSQGRLASLTSLPMSFEVNHGQCDPRVTFVAHLAGYVLYLTRSAAVLAFAPQVSAGANFPISRRSRPSFERAVTLRWLGATSRPRIVGVKALPGRVNYFAGRDRRRWHTNIPTYAGVEYRHVYPGIDLSFHGSGRQVEYDWIVEPGARPDAITLTMTGMAGRARINGTGTLVMRDRADGVIQARPFIYQRVHGRKRRVLGGWRVSQGRRIGFWLGGYDSRLPLIIDPVLSYSVQVGGSSSDFASDVAVDSAGNAYITGSTLSADFPLHNPVKGWRQGGAANSQSFVTELNATGTALVYSSYLGGGSYQTGHGIVVDARGNAYVTGSTESPDFPTVRPLPNGRCDHSSLHGDAFISEVSAGGSRLMYSTCLAGSDGDSGIRIALGRTGDVYIAGTTISTDFPTVGAFQGANGGHADAVVARLDTVRDRLVYSTYLGGSEDEAATGIAVDAVGNVYVSGWTSSLNFPTLNALQTTNRGGTEGTDGFVVKFDPSGRSLIYGTYLGGREDDVASGIAVGSDGSAYIAGGTASPDFPTASALQATNHGGNDAFIARLSPSGTSLMFSTYLGGSSDDEAFDIALDAGNNAYITGYSRSEDFPTVEAVQPAYGGGHYYGDSFIVKMSSDGRALTYSTYLGGQSDDVGMGIAVDAAGNTFVVGGTSSIDFPMAGPRGLERPERGNAFVAKIGTGTSVSLGKPAITIDQVAILHRVQGDLQLTTVLHLREKALFVVFYHAMNGGSSIPTAHIRFTHNGSTLYSGEMKRAKLPDGVPYFMAYEHFRGKKLLGHVVARVSLTLSSANDTQLLPFTLKSR